jgi:hypothetical protein
MPLTGNSPTSLANLTERLKSKTEEDRQTAERLIEAAFESLSANVSKSMKNALNTIENAIGRETATIRESMTGQIRLLNNGFLKHWLVCGLLGLGLICGTALGGWSLTTLAHRYINSLRRDISTLNQQKASLEATLNQLKNQTWNLELTETQEGRFIILPPKVIPKPGWTVGSRQAIKLE